MPGAWVGWAPGERATGGGEAKGAPGWERRRDARRGAGRGRDGGPLARRAVWRRHAPRRSNAPRPRFRVDRVPNGYEAAGVPLFLGTAVKISASARRAPPHPARTQSPEARVHVPSARVHAPSARVPPSPHAVAATRRDGVVRRGAASSRVPAAPARVGTRGRRRRRPVIIPDVALVVHARRVRGLVGIRVGRVRGLGGGGRRGLVASG